MQWQLIPETTMHAIDINALLTMIAINKLTDWTGADPEMTGNGHNYFFSMINATVKNTHAAVPEKLTINLFWS
jgi:spore coat protein CotH